MWCAKWARLSSLARCAAQPARRVETRERVGCTVGSSPRHTRTELQRPLAHTHTERHSRTQLLQDLLTTTRGIIINVSCSKMLILHIASLLSKYCFYMELFRFFLLRRQLAKVFSMHFRNSLKPSIGLRGNVKCEEIEQRILFSVAVKVEFQCYFSLSLIQDHGDLY